MKPKQLIWRRGIAETPFGPYWVFLHKPTGGTPFYDVGFRTDVRSQHQTKREAQAAAQADFERRARECFEENDND